MAKTKRTPGPDRQYGERRDYHIKVPVEYADQFEEKAKSQGGIIKYVNQLIQQDLGLVQQVENKEQ